MVRLYQTFSYIILHLICLVCPLHPKDIQSEIFNLKGITIALTAHDITTIPADGIVNAANKTLPWPAGGVCRAIYLAAGSEELDAWVKTHTQADVRGNRISLGNALVSPSFKLKKAGIQHIIHAVGPDARINEPESAVYDTYKNSLIAAHSVHAHSIAFPAISTGIFAGNKNKIAQYSLAAIADHAQKNDIHTIYLCIYDSEYYDICKTLLQKAEAS